jgi:hypothetical protein
MMLTETYSIRWMGSYRLYSASQLLHHLTIILLGLTVGQVRVIFQLPGEFGIFQHPLAYVEWFTAFQTPVADLDMYKLSRSFRHHRRRATIIPVTQIERWIRRG